MPRFSFQPRWIGLALALVTLLGYLRAGQQGFILYDDPEYVAQNRMVQAGLTAAGMRWALTTFHGNLWIPVTWISHMMDCELFGADAGAHHVVNALLHAANAVLLFCVLLYLLDDLWPSAFAAALFAWHPLRVESVAWAAERKDVLSGLFFLLAIWAYARFATGFPRGFGSGGWPLRPKDTRSFYFLSLASFACGLMSKPMLVTLPFVLLLLDYWPLKRLGLCGVRRQTEGGAPQGLRSGWPAVLWEKVPFFALSAGICVVTSLAARSEAVGTAHYTMVERLANAAAAYASYLVKTLAPVDLAIVYPLPTPPPWGRAAAGAAMLAIVGWLAWRGRASRPWWLTGWLWFAGTLAPVLGLVQVGTQAFADRFTYIPFMGLAMAAACEGAWWARRLRLQPAIVGAAGGSILAACLALTEHQLTYWDSNERLFEHALGVTPENPVAHANLGVAFEQAGRLPEARAHYEAALGLMPSLAQVHNNLAGLLDRAGETNAALAQFAEARRLKPEAPLVHANYGSMLLKLGRFDEAVAEFAESARLSPDDPRPYYLLGKARLRQGRSPEAARQLGHALEMDPNDVPALVFLARLLATDPDAALRDGRRAVELAERASALTGGQQPAVLDVLAMAYAEAGRFTEARAAARKALEGAVSGGETRVLPELRRRLELFAANQPYRQTATNSETGLPSDPPPAGRRSAAR